jgi:hypothetical protein
MPTTTDQRTQFLIQVLDKIGGPLSSAIAAGPVLESDGANAQRLAELLNRSVQLGLSVASQMNVSDEGQADGVHLALAAFASPLMAGQYLVTGQVPPENDVKRMTTALQAVLSFADNFTPAADSTARIKDSDPGNVQPVDEALVFIQILTAFAPVFQVVSDYSFGKSENKLIQDIGSRLMLCATGLRNDMFGDTLPIKTRYQVEIVMMKLLCGLYAACHAAEMRRLMALSDQARAKATISLDPVWGAFEKQATMAKIIAETIIPGVAPAPVKEVAGEKAPKAIATGKKKKAKEPAAGQNPMAFFAKSPPKASEDDENEEEGDEEETGGKQGDSGANPMAFFAKKK